MKRLLITGSNGTIGKILKRNLEGTCEILEADLPKVDVSDYNQLKKIAKSCDAIIHLAWNSKEENSQNDKIYLPNAKMFENVYKVARELKIPKVIMASSIHADNFRRKTKKLLNPTDSWIPTSPYGAHKIFMESLGKYYAKNNLKVICIRIGAIGETEPPTSKEGKLVWVSKRDFVSLIEKIISAKKIKDNFSVIYAVSNNKGKVHDTKNKFGWKPKDNSSK